jgi:hypothetical protein
VLHGTLSRVLQGGKKSVNIFLPEGYDLNMPINNIQLRFQIAGSSDACKDYINSGHSTCMINKLYRAVEATEAKITVSGLFRINGWNTMKTQREHKFFLNNNDDPFLFSNAGSGDSNDPGKILNDASRNWEEFAQWYISGQLLSLSSKKSGKSIVADAVVSVKCPCSHPLAGISI